MDNQDFHDSDLRPPSTDNPQMDESDLSNSHFVEGGARISPSLPPQQLHPFQNGHGNAWQRRDKLRGMAAVFIVTLTSGLICGICAARMHARPSSGDLSLVSLVRGEQQAVNSLENENVNLKSVIDQEVKDVGESSGGTNTDLSSADGRISGKGIGNLSDPQLSAVSGPGITITLTDAPVSSASRDATPDDLVVHQQDIDNVMNALWKGGAEVMSVQGVRLTPRSVVRCIGNVIRVDGLSYSPPYVISAIGNPHSLQKAVAESPEISIYKSYVVRYGLGWKVAVNDYLSFDKIPPALPTKYACIVEDHG